MNRYILIFCLLISFTSLHAKKVLLVGVGNLNGGEKEMHAVKNNPHTIMGVYYDAWWKIIKKLKEHDIEVSLCKQSQFKNTPLKELKIYDLLIFQDFPNFHSQRQFKPIFKKSFLLLWESFVVMPYQYNRRFIRQFSTVFSWDDDLVDNDKVIKICYPVRKPFVKGLPFHQRKLSCMLAANKMFNSPHQLYSERQKIIRFYDTHVQRFDLYGRGWDNLKLKCYKGNAPFKSETLQKYRFNFCLENNAFNKGYISEKIFDAFQAGAIPIYKGPPNTSKYIPSNCYIDYNKYGSLEKLDRFIQDFTEADYNRYISNIRKYLTSKMSDQFSSDGFVKIMVPKILEKLGKKKL